MADDLLKSAVSAEHAPVDSVLLIDGDNDPHFPPDFAITARTLVRVFLRTGAKMPRALERKVGALPQCVSVVSPKGGGNAADFVMSLHAGLLHAMLPVQVPFTLVTADKSLSVMAQELQRVGRIAVLWTSHPERGGARRRGAPKAEMDAAPAAAQGQSSGRGRSRRGRGGRGSGAPARPAPARPEAGPGEAARPAAPTSGGGRSLADVAASYASRLARIKDPPSRLKALLNDIKNRAGSTSYTPEDVFEELKRSHGLSVDERGKVSHPGRG